MLHKPSASNLKANISCPIRPMISSGSSIPVSCNLYSGEDAAVYAPCSSFDACSKILAAVTRKVSLRRIRLCTIIYYSKGETFCFTVGTFSLPDCEICHHISAVGAPSTVAMLSGTIPQSHLTLISLV